MLIIRLLRVLRVFRVLKLVRYMSEANLLLRSLCLGRRKILNFFFTVIVISFIFGSLMFLIEGPENRFTSIPKSIYWTIVTVTTVGYGDITPQTAMGQIIAVLAMLTGYSIITIPTGIVTAEKSDLTVAVLVMRRMPFIVNIVGQTNYQRCKIDTCRC